MQPTAARGFLAELTEADRRELAGLGEVQTFVPGTYVCRQGEVGDHAALILRGTVKVSISAADGSSALLGLCGPGELVGELSALRGAGGLRTASVTAVDTVTCRVIGSARFRALLGDRPGVQRAITLMLAERTRRVAADKLHSMAYPISARIAQTLLELACQHGRPAPGGTLIGLALSQADLAQLVGGSRESVVRALAELRGRGLVSTGRRRITVLDPGALRACATGRP